MFILEREEIDDLETFFQLDEKDFTRLSLTTKQIKIIQRVQAQYKEVTEEWIDEESYQDAQQLTVKPNEPALIAPTTPTEPTDPNQPYREIRLDEVRIFININILLT